MELLTILESDTFDISKHLPGLDTSNSQLSPRVAFPPQALHSPPRNTCQAWKHITFG
ncbi:hypothetical protein C8Q74DRAFT_1307541 [Fomes fomentarius]|nr:hypothetical protein C8Q74DRAFT_1307541 [Fomes fomentarius]